MLDDAESREVLRVAAEAAAPEKVLIAGVGRESVKATVALAEAAARFRYDAVLVRTPTYYASQMIAGGRASTTFAAWPTARPCRCCSTTFPNACPTTFPSRLAAELAQHPNIIGIKDSSGSVERIRALVEPPAPRPAAP